MQNNIEVIHQ